MMVETILESSQDFSMSNGALPQWKRELLQRRAARARPPAAPPQPPPLPPPPPPPPPRPPTDALEEDEELRYGPGIVKRLKSRYLSLALRDAPRRRPSVLRRAASLEHLLEERPPPSPSPSPAPRAPPSHAAHRQPQPHPRPPRPASVAAPPPAFPPSPRRESMKRARSVDALSRLDSREDPRHPLPPPLAPRPPPMARSARPPRRPTPLLRETERPPPDVVRSTLRKFESAPPRRTAPAARVSAVLRGLEAPQRTSTPEPECPDAMPRSPSPPSAAPPSPIPDLPEILAPVLTPASAEAKQVSRAALEGIARAGSSTRYAFEAPRLGSHLPPLSATNAVLVGRARRIGVIRPMPSPTFTRSESSPPREEPAEKTTEANNRIASPPPESEVNQPAWMERREPPPSAMVEPIPRVVPEPMRGESPRPVTPPPRIVTPEPKPAEVITPAPYLNGHGASERLEKVSCVASKIVAAGIERAWSGSADKRDAKEKSVEVTGKEGLATPWGAQRRPRAPPPAATSVVFNFSDRKEVPDYIENDGIVLRSTRRNRIKAGEPGVVVLRPEALALKADSESEDEADCGPPSPCGVKFVNDNVLINGKSSMTANTNRDRIVKLKLQFDDSLTRTFEYPSETSLYEEGASPPAPTHSPCAPSPAPSPAPSDACPLQCAESSMMAPLAANTHIVSAALSRYTPSKTTAAAFQLGVTRNEPAPETAKPTTNGVSAGGDEEAEGAGGGGDVRPCAHDAAAHWSEARALATDLLF